MTDIKQKEKRSPHSGLLLLLLFSFLFFLVGERFRLSCISCQSGPGSLSAALQEDRSDLIEIKGHLEIALLEKHFLREYVCDSSGWI